MDIYAGKTTICASSFNKLAQFIYLMCNDNLGIIEAKCLIKKVQIIYFACTNAVQINSNVFLNMLII